MNTHLLKKIGTLVAHSLFVASIMMPVAAFAQTPTGAQPSNTTVTNSAANTPTTNTATTQSGGTGSTFVPLTQLPGIGSVATADSFSSFLNTLYKICIGAGAVLAVLMIMYAGVLFMTSQGSVSSNEKAKSYIQNALLGLLLVLTPTIVFGIINPSILNINIGAEFSKLTIPLQSLSPNTTAPTSSQTCSTQYSSISAVNPGGSCSGVANSKAIDNSCCSNLAQGGVCCGVPKTTTPTTPATSNPSSQPATAATGYGWAIYMVPKGKTTPENLASKGPFTTSQQCTASLSTFLSENNVDVSGNKAPLCNCSSPISSQPGCPVR